MTLRAADSAAGRSPSRRCTCDSWNSDRTSAGLAARAGVRLGKKSRAVGPAGLLADELLQQRDRFFVGARCEIQPCQRRTDVRIRIELAIDRFFEMFDRLGEILGNRRRVLLRS